MGKKLKLTTPKRVIVVEESDNTPFWLDHLVALIVFGLIVLIGGMVVLSLTDWGRATMVGIGLGLSVVMAVWLAIDPVRSFRAGQPTTVWAGEALAAFGWTGMTVSLAAGLPFAFWRGVGLDAEWLFAIPGVGSMAFTAIAGLGMFMQTRGPLPALDRTPRSARVMFNDDDADGGQLLTVRYRGSDGEKHDAELADVIDDTWMDRFAPGTTWRVYAFRNPRLAESVVFLTEEHDDVWRKGYKLNGVRLGGEGGPVKPGPGSPFLREDSKWSFES